MVAPPAVFVVPQAQTAEKQPKRPRLVQGLFPIEIKWTDLFD